jgi:capsular polysaccharide export protein
MVRYTGSATVWPRYVVRLARQHEVADVVLMGDARPLHRSGVNALRLWRPDIRIHVFEEGYLRPDWITLEQNGVNGWSSLPRDAHSVEKLALSCTEPLPHEHIGPALLPMAQHSVSAYLAMWLLSPAFARYQHHRPYGPLAETGRWALRLLELPMARLSARKLQRDLQSDTAPQFAVLLQLETDKQVQVHSRYSSIREFLIEVVQSFAAHAAPDAQLIVKAHPLDCTSRSQKRLLRRLAREFGLEGRTRFLDGGHLPTLLSHCAGAVTINSTAGLSALHRGVPLIALGTAVYDIPGLTHQAGLDLFWQQPWKPDPVLYKAFRRVAIHMSQINGSFYKREGIELAVAAAIERLTRDPPPTRHGTQAIKSAQTRTTMLTPATIDGIAGKPA